MRLPVVSDDFLDDLLGDGSKDPSQIPNERPRNRSECRGGYRPCPWVSCKYHLYLDVRADGVLRLNFPGKEVEDILQTCALDLAEDGTRTLDQIAGIMGMSKERVRQLEESAMKKIRAAGRQEHGVEVMDLY